MNDVCRPQLAKFVGLADSSGARHLTAALKLHPGLPLHCTWYAALLSSNSPLPAGAWGTLPGRPAPPLAHGLAPSAYGSACQPCWCTWDSR